MKLKLVDIRGYKRFRSRSRLDARGPVVAVVGPNEAGKTSLLCALEHVSSDDAFDISELTDRRPVDTNTWVVGAHFSMEPEEREELGELLPRGVELTYRYYRYADGSTRYGVDPALPRDKAHRKRAATALRAALRHDWFARAAGAKADDEAAELIRRGEALVEALNGEHDWLSAEVRSELGALGGAVLAGLPEEVGDEVDTEQKQLASALQVADAQENEPPPGDRIHRILEDRVPMFLMFDDAERALETEYVWKEHGQAPRALANLLALAETRYGGLRSAALQDDRATLDDLEEAANSKLEEAFKAWRQAELHVTLSANQNSLQLLVRDRAAKKRTRLDERSAGLRSFVALVAFTARYAGGDIRPVLLVDEAETHLHYGAQADLVRVFERQRAAETIIYTTHSIGSLPSDLGAAIRVVAPIAGERYRSTVHNSFWSARRGAGMTPMMLAMGADALAFTPSRRAVIGEGPSEAILLPSLLREALPPGQREEPLGYQVVPGVSEVDPDDAEAMELEAGGVAYLVDDDTGGRRHGRKLPERAKREDRVVVLGGGREQSISLEDLVAADVLTEAANRLIARRDSEPDDRLSADELPHVGRAVYITEWCEQRGFKLKKVDLAQEALDIGRDRGRLVEPARRQLLRELHKRLLRATNATTSGDEA